LVNIQYIKRSGFEPLGGASPSKTLFSTSPPPGRNLAESDISPIGLTSPATSHSNEELEWLSSWKEVRAGKLEIEEVNL